MTNARRERLQLLARATFAFTILGVAAGFWLSFIDQEPTDLGLVFAFGLFPIVGYLMAVRRPENSLGWIMLGMGVAIALGGFLSSYAGYAVHGGIGGRDLGLIAESLNTPMWVPVVAVPATYLLLLFPDGHLPSPRWRWFAWVLGVSLVITALVIILAPGKFGSEAGGFADYENPLGVEALRPVLAVAIVSLAMLPIGVIVSLVALVRRFRRSSGIERLQLRWLVTAATIVAVLYTVALLISFAGSWDTNNQPGWMNVLQNLAVFSFGLIPIAIGVSVLRYHLFDIDVVITRAVLFGTLAVFITLVYVAIVVGVGAIVGSRADPILSAVAAAVIALAFQPVRSRAQRFADRLVYGERAAPYEVLSEFSARLGNTYANDELLPRMARVLAGGTGATHVDVWVRIGDELVSGARWPQDAEAPPPITVGEDDAGHVSDIEMREPIRHQGELLGALSTREAAGRPDHPDGGEARPRPGLTGGPRDAQRDAGGAADGQHRAAPRLARATRRRAGRGASEAGAEPPRRRPTTARRAVREAAPGRGVRRPGPGEDEGDARRSPDGDGSGDRGPSRPRAWHLPAAPRGQRLDRRAGGAGA